MLIADGLATHRISLAAALDRAFYDVLVTGSGAEALRSMRRERPDLVIASTSLPDLDPTRFCARAQALAGGGDMPLILLGGALTRPERLALLAAGADDVLSAPVDRSLLLAGLRNRLRARAADAELTLRDDTRLALGLAEAAGTAIQSPARVALIEMSAEHDLPPMLERLRSLVPDQIELLAASEALRATASPPEAFIIVETGNQPNGGLALLTQLRASPSARNAALLYVGRASRPRQAAAALDLGADDVLMGALDPDELALRLPRQIARKRNRDRQRANLRDGAQAALIDPLTGLYNRRYALPHVARLVERATVRNRGFALLLADLDHFKQVNDRFGHAAGDVVLREVARRLNAILRPSDLVARIGGEEFLVTLPDATAETAHAVAQRLRASVAARRFTLPGTPARLPVTLSIGLALSGSGAAPGADALLERADRALYAAKDAGRDRVMAWPDLHDTTCRAVGAAR
ncbi:diguanylate cyclase [Salipiger bermudensis]|uniref:diguanylate cyclase n=1 Tax=Salipiger bermudensis TaxID=344736 RepID=UPI0035133DA9